MPRREKESSEELIDEEDIQDINPYEILGLEKTCTEDEVKKAYRIAALRNHPDKVAPEKKDEATKKFQDIALAYAVLSNSNRRAYYDRTGSTSETVHKDGDFDWSDFYRTQFFETVTEDAITKFKEYYKGSEEEKDDLLTAYEEGEGDMDHVYECVMLSNVLEDDERFRQIIDDAIASDEVKAFKKYSKETAASKKRRVKAAEGEAAEAIQLAEELGVKDKLFGDKKGKKKEGGDEALMALIQGRQKDRLAQGDDFLARLEAKYAQPAKKGKGSGKRKKEVEEEEPSEEAFAAARERLERGKDGDASRRGARKKTKA